MSSVIQLGRVGLDVTTQGLVRIDSRGEALTIGTDWLLPSVTDAKAVRQQLLGLVNNPDVTAEPLVYSDDTDFTGFYRVLDVRVSTERFTGINGHLSWDAQLERVRGYSAAEAELVQKGANRSGKPVGITAQYWTAVPSTWAGLAHSALTGGTGLSAQRLTSASAGPFILRDFATLLTSAASVIAPAASYYDQAATIQTGTSLRTVVGRQIISTPSNWLLTNGIVQVVPPSSTAYACAFKFQKANGSAPSLTYDLAIGYGNAGSYTGFTLGAPKTLTVLRNCAEECIIRLTWGASDLSSNYELSLDIGLRRGAVGATLHFDSHYYQLQWNYRWQQAAVGAWTAITADNVGIFDNATDADGNERLLVGTAVGIGTTVGRVYSTSATATTLDGFAGYVPNSGAAADTAANTQAQFFGASTETCQIVAKG